LLCVAPHRAAAAAASVADTKQVARRVTLRLQPNAAEEGNDRVVVDLGPAVEREEEAVGRASSKEAAAQKKREKIASLLWLEGRLREVRQSLDNKDFEAGEQAEQQAAGKDSRDAESTARMLSQMREQMHQFAAPVYRKAIDDELLDVTERRQALLQEIAPTDPPAVLVTEEEPIKTGQDIIEKKKNNRIRSARTGQVVFGLSVIMSVGLLIFAHMKKED